jgi:ribonucleoside-diphosphate reductase alpha chain
MNDKTKQGFDSVNSLREIREVKKRDGSTVQFSTDKVRDAAYNAMLATEETKDPFNDATWIARNVESALRRAATLVGSGAEIVPSVEQISDAIERELLLHGFTDTARAFIRYRDERARVREAQIPEHVKALVAESKKHFPNDLSEFVYTRTYSRWIEGEGRRETWVETVDRYMSFMREKLGDKLKEFDDGAVSYSDIRTAILNMEVMPSMRLMWSAGDACRRTNVTAFNCAFIAPSCFQDFAEILYILACGTGVGFSCESRSAQLLPVISMQTGLKTIQGRIGKYVVADSKEGWADALAWGMERWYDGENPEFDYSNLRPEGARLKTMGGRSSGPKPFIDLMNFVRGRILSRQGRRLTNLDVHDIVCKIGDAIVAGGVRRSALISLSDLDDVNVRDCKKGHFFISDPQRQLANNSAVYDGMPDDEVLMREWLALVESRSGERGIFNRGDLADQIPNRRLEHWQEMGHASGNRIVSQLGTNPCGEITLLSKQFCNLTEVVCRKGDTVSTLQRKVEIATVLGTYQAMLTYYPYLSRDWTENCERERLLGVSLTGMWDCPAVRQRDHLHVLRQMAIETNLRYSVKFGVGPSTAVTCIKPSGTVSQLVDASSGMHPRHSLYYIRRVRINSHDPLFMMLRDAGVPCVPDVGMLADSATRWVFDFPVKSPTGAYRDDLTALEQLEFWKMVKTSYTEHNPSITVTVDKEEWVHVLAWIRGNWEIIGGLSFLPKDDHVYALAPYEACGEEQYNKLLAQFANVDYSRLVAYEREDQTEGSKELACVAGFCEI